MCLIYYFSFGLMLHIE